MGHPVYLRMKKMDKFSMLKLKLQSFNKSNLNSMSKLSCTYKRDLRSGGFSIQCIFVSVYGVSLKNYLEFTKTFLII